MARKSARPALRYHGGKWMLGSWIISQFPAHRNYVEPYGGAASVLLKKPRSYHEVYNDLNGEIVSFFRVLQNGECARELERRLRVTPFARAEFELAYEKTNDPVENARRLVIRSFMGFGSAAHNAQHATGFRGNNGRKAGGTPQSDWRNYPEFMAAMTERLRGVCIEQRPALDVIRAQDRPETLFYVDPPYVHSTRKPRQGGNYGDYEMKDDDHCELADALAKARGKVVLSGYDSPLYRGLYAGWRVESRRTCGNGNCGASARLELLWMNF